MSSSFPLLSLSIIDLWPSLSRTSGKKVDTDAVLPFFVVPLLLAGAMLSVWTTFIVMVITAMGVLYVCSRPWAKNRSPFFFSWTLASWITMFLIFEIMLLPLFEVTQLEHFIFLVLLASTLYFFYKMKATADFELALGSSKGKEYSPVLTSDSFYCPICQIEVNERFFHSIWWDCCVLRPNYPYYLAGLVFAFVAFLHGTNLGLTTVCQSYVFYANILLPEDCSNVYFDYQTSLVFVACVYGAGYLLVITLVLIQQFIVYVPKYFRCTTYK